MSSEVCPFCGKSFKRLKSHLPHCKAAKSSKTTSPRHEETNTSTTASSSSSSLPPNANQTQHPAKTDTSLDSKGNEQAAKTLKKPNSMKETKLKLSEKIKMAAAMSSPTSVASTPPSLALKSKRKSPTSSQIDKELIGNNVEKVHSSLNAKPKMTNSSSTKNNQEIIHKIEASIEQLNLNQTEEQLPKPKVGMKNLDNSQSASKKKEVKGILTKKSSSNKAKVSVNSVKMSPEENVWLGGEKNERSLRENERRLPENERSLRENERRLPENGRSLRENERRLPENERSLRENEKSLSENEKSLSENEKSLSENEKSLRENERRLRENERSLRENKRSLPENERSLLENERSLQENKRSLPENERSLLENERSLLENERSLQENKRSSRENDTLTSRQEAKVTLHDVRAALGRARQNGRRKDNSFIEELVKESENRSLILLRETPSQLMALTAEKSQLLPLKSGHFLSELSKVESTDCIFSQRADVLKDGLRMDGHSMGLVALSSPARTFLEAEVSSEAFGKDAAALFKNNLQEAKREMEEKRRDMRKRDEGRSSARGALSQQRLGQVMLRELPDWLVSRSPRRPRDALQLLHRGWQWYYRKYINVKKGGIGGVAMLLAGYCVLSYVWAFPHLKRDRWRKYH